MEQSVALIGAVALAGIWWRSQYRPTAAPADVELFKRRYADRGLSVVNVRRIGTDWNVGGSPRYPIRKYEIEVETPSGLREIRVRGVSRGDLLRERIWRYDRQGRRQPLG